MKVTAIRSDKIYKKMVSAKPEDRDNIYRYELMKPFEFKWSCVGIPIKSDKPDGYDVVMASSMGGGFLPKQINAQIINDVEKISDESFWKDCQDSITKTLEGFEYNGISLPTKDYIFTVLLNDPLNPMSKMTGDYCGDGGIPGYIIGTIIPNEKSLKMLPVALAHEANHNVRWQFIKWNNEITLGDMIVSEGLAENFAAAMFGEDKIGMWVKNTSKETLENVIKPAIKENINNNDFNKLSSFLYGDEIMAIRGIPPIGMPYCAGYACGYQLIKYYLKKTGKTIFEATITPTADILKETEEFWK
ncbi:Zn-dependent protease [Clostridium botulinum]|uniref:Zn-dependent protease n=1 Tax=Clostridium botulinum TaxID=1491 RepID=A0AAU8YZQ2_CLOBO|nr:DUF2268 domain-containing protein [Clostridium sporogenes]AVP65202.1 Zn-dependent protease [Clostridium botulinum]MCF4017487.1 DUF2268 domain-containing protein [Clostridium sporogenes]NFG01090.1 Zn-dependent protease [Clostridium sporogenes]